MSFPLTTQQRAVVTDRGGCLLVAAAAGSGKTRVLVERLLSRVEDEGLDIDRFLVITYTKAAAAELRGRIVDELAARLAKKPGDRHLRRQATLVYKTQISTIHAFCAQLLRECGHLLDLEADFRLCDEGEAGVLRLRAMDDLLERRYETIGEDPDFALLVDTLSAGRDDSRLVQIALDIYGKVQAHPDPSAWLREQLAAFDLSGTADAGETVWGRLLLADAARQGRYWQGRMAHARELCAGDEKLERGYAPSLSATVEGLGAFAAAAEAGWDRAAALSEIPFPKLGAVRSCGDPMAQEQIKAIREKCKKRMGKLRELLQDSSADLLADMALVWPAVRGLFALVEDFSAAYTAEKRRRSLLDFADLEHLAVALLTEDGAPTELAEQWSARFDEVMVDEYQDTNEVQNAIFQAVSGGGRKLFLVGDVKQSIYRFRLADPTIFLEKYRTFRPAGEAAEGEPRRILLTRNFRSRPQVLEGANDLFRALMSREFGEMDYGPDESLYPGAAFPGDEADYAVELDAIDLSGGGDGEDGGEGETPARDLLEARFVARRVRELLDEGFQVSDGGGGLRPVRCADIVVLLRSPNTVLRHYARAFGERDIPWEAEGGEDFFASTEGNVALSLLQIIDNPRQDVALLSVLRSPICGFTADRLALLRGADGKTDFYGCLLLGAERGEADCLAFLKKLDELRDLAGELSCHQLLWQVYDRTDLLGVFGAMGDGERRRGNLLALAQCARQFEEAGHKGLFGFLTHLARLRENGETLTAAATGREGAGVRLMSIHKSKGLEFPVVILAGLARRLNREDMQKPMLFHPKLGVGPKGLDRERMVEFTTLARKAVARQLEGEMMAEELRLLYVAVTRAKEKLILSCALTGGARELQRLAGDAGCPVEPQALLATQSVGQWVLLCALARPDGEALRRAAECYVDVTAAPCGPAWDIRWVDGGPLFQAPGRRSSRQEGPEADLAAADRGLAERLAWTYPHAADADIPSKLTATQLKGRALDEEVREGAGPATEPSAAPAPFGRPRFAAEELGLTAAQKGTALHLVMQYLDFERAGTREGAAEEIRRLVDRALLTPEQGEAADPARIAAFFASDLGRELMASTSLHREYKFSILVPAADYYAQAGAGEKVLLQGVVDCWFETLEGITVVDFKTDRVTEQTVLARAKEYRPQLMAYSRALEEVTGRRVVRRVLWFFRLDRAVEV
ncbi:ATP-dependent helicase/nuclease subunit A [Oscillospiraceae bacterium]|nr:ATP-dependent helicase/nuclease subunit A [Oscillospiraceae bacterium]